MDRATELELLSRCLQLARERGTQLSTTTAVSPVERYFDPKGFERELQQLFRRLPTVVAHAAQLPAPHGFLSVDGPLGALLVTRDGEGAAHVFRNVCRHRGTRLVDEPSGCAEQHRCPYHAWTYSSSGALVGVPHGESCFPGLDRTRYGLSAIESTERYGFIWAQATASGVDEFLAGLAPDLAWLELASLTPFAVERRIWQANWKLIAEGGLESYHFRQAHKATIASYFFDNLSIWQRFGAHFRSVLPRRSLLTLADVPQDRWPLREHTHLTYQLLPMTTLLVQADHVVWVQAQPRAIDRTEVTIATLAPQAAGGKPSDSERSHWQTNHDITCATLAEDFALAESIQAGLASGANSELLFGRNEGALAELQQVIEDFIRTT